MHPLQHLQNENLYSIVALRYIHLGTDSDGLVILTSPFISVVKLLTSTGGDAFPRLRHCYYGFVLFLVWRFLALPSNVADV